jgi:hypothetical protein
MLKDDIGFMYAAIKSSEDLRCHNHDLLMIFEGELKSYVEESLRHQLAPKSMQVIKHRLAPVNILRRITTKLAKIYKQPPIRTVEGSENEADKELLTYYQDCFKINRVMKNSNLFFNLFKNNLLHTYLDNGVPKLRSIPSDRFVVASDNKLNPQEPTHVMLIYGKDVNNKVIYHAYTDSEFIIFDSDQVYRPELMAAIESDGTNPIGKLPFVYTNRSDNFIMPIKDSDIFTMTLLIPILLSDLNYAIMFQAFSVFYGIDVDDENIVWGPNSFLKFKTDPDKLTKPEIGTLKPQVDITSVVQYIGTLLAFWLQSKGIRPGAVGSLTAENSTSGISKIVDEMDTSEDRMEQVEIYKDTEYQLWDLIVNYAHPYWVKNNLLTDQTLTFSTGAWINTNFAEQLPLVSREVVVKGLVEEMNAGFISRKEAIQKLNPDLSGEDIDIKIEDMDKENDTVPLPAT